MPFTATHYLYQKAKGAAVLSLRRKSKARESIIQEIAAQIVDKDILHLGE